MLNAIRKRAGSWVVKILLLLLVLSFAVWGIGDIFYGGDRNPAVATVGDSEILASELETEFSRVLNSMQQRLGGGIDRQQAIQLGLMQQALQDLIIRRLVDLRAREMGLTVDDDTLRRLITDNPAFQTAGQFDRSRFEQLLLASGMTEEGYLAALRQEVLRGTLTESLTAPLEVPPFLVESLYRHRNEQRRGRMLQVRADQIEDVPEPDQAALEAFHEQHAQRFTAPEYRQVTFVTIEPEDMLDEVAIADEEVEAVYQDQAGRFRTPERRTVEQLLAGEREAIEQALERVQAGASFAEAAEALAADGVAFSELGEVAEGQLPPAMDEVIFATTEGEVSRPVESPFGWHLFRVAGVQPEEVTPLSEVQDEIRRNLALDEAAARLPSLANALDDELAAGTPLEEAARAVGLAVESVAAVDVEGLGSDGEQPEALPSWPTFLDVAFATPAGETSLLEETDDGAYFVLRVDQVTPPRLRPLDEVRDEVANAWRVEERRRLARERAEQLLARLDEGTPFDQLAEDEAVEVVEMPPLTRTDQGLAAGAGPAAVQALFRTEPGDVAQEVVEIGGGFAVVTTDEVIGALPADDPEAAERLEAELRAEMQADLLTQFGEALRDAYPVSINSAEVARLMTGEGGLTGGAATPASSRTRP